MPYNKQTWIDGDPTKPLSAARMNILEQALFDATAAVESAQAQIEALASAPPAQTTTITPQPGNASVTLNWTAAVGATGYTVSATPIGVNGNTPAAVTKTAAELTHTFTGLTNGISYQASVTIAPSGAQKTVPFTPTAGAAAVTLSKVERDGEVVISWTGAVDATGYLVGRNGTDTNGSGPWSTTDPATARSRTFGSLTNGTTYTFSVQPLPGGATQTITGTPNGSVVTPPPPPPPSGAGTTWLSGACGDHTTNANGQFATWRGEPVTFARGWADASLAAMQGMDFMFAFKNANWNGVLDMAIGGPRPDFGQTWASAATGGMDSIWRGQLQKVNANWWPNLKGVSLSMAHELSGNWYPWSVNSGNVTAFKTAWRRFYNIVQEELVSKGRKAMVTINYNFDTVSDLTVQQIDPGTAYYNWVGVDIYNMWWGGSVEAGLNTQAAWDANLNAMKGTSPRGPNAWFTYASSIGKPICVPEWGANPQRVIDSPLFITNMRNFFASKAPADPYNPGAGKLAGDAYFNTWPECTLWPTTQIPNSATAYRNLSWGR